MKPSLYFERGLYMLLKTRKSGWRKSALLVIAAMLVMTIVAGCGNNKKGDYSLQFKGVDKGEVVATYEGGQVTQTEFDKYLALLGLAQPESEAIFQIPQFQEMILEQYVSYKVIGTKATADTMTKAKELVTDQLKQFKDLKKENKDFNKLVKDKKVSDDDMATFLMLTAVLVTHMNSLVTDEDMQKAYETLQPNFAISTVRHILVNTVEINQQTGEQKEVRTDEEALKRVNEAKEKLLANEDWDKLAKEYSDDGGSKEKGGLYADTDASGWVEPFKQAAFKQEIGVIGEPVKTEYGYHIIKVEKRDVTALDKLSESQKAQVKDSAAYAHLEKFLDEEMEKLNIKITLPQPEPSPGESPGESPETSPEASPETSPEASPKASPEASETPAK